MPGLRDFSFETVRSFAGIRLKARSFSRLDRKTSFLLRVSLGVALSALVIGAINRVNSPTQRTVAIGYPAIGIPMDSLVVTGIEMALSQLNAESEDSGLRFVLRLPKSISRDPVRAAAQLRGDPDVIGVVGNIWSQDVLDAAAEYEEVERADRPPVTVIAPVATNGDLSGISPWFFRLAATDSVQAVAAARFARDSFHARRAAIFYSNDAYGRDWSRVFRATFLKLGGTVIAREPLFKQPDDLALMVEYTHVLAPDIIVLAGLSIHGTPVLAALSARGRDLPLLTGDDGWNTTPVTVGKAPRMYYASIFAAQDADRPEAIRFVTEFRRRHPRQRGLQLPAFAFDAALTLGRAVLAVGPDRRRVRDYIESLGQSRPALAGVTGLISFDADHDNSNGFVRMTQIRPWVAGQ